ncbi:MAG: epoxide hydrolase [Solirubrobacterales bacterium]|nr:epoxide hydrolase [Solirubrobacterales bacterium]
MFTPTLSEGRRRPTIGRRRPIFQPQEEQITAVGFEPRTSGGDTAIRPFHVEFPDEALEDLRRRIAAVRLPSEELVTDRSQGVQLKTIQELARYWTDEYDWRRCEARLNALAQFKTEIDGVDVHFIHVKSRHEHALPLIITHGWPGSIIELLEVIGPLTDPTAHGGSAEDAFHLVLPSLPGYGFSAAPSELGWNAARFAEARAKLMPRLGYARYVAQGGDVGAIVTDAMGRQAPDGLIGIHTNLFVPGSAGFPRTPRRNARRPSRTPHLGRPASATSSSRPRGRRRSATPCSIHRSRWRPGCSTTTPIASSAVSGEGGAACQRSKNSCTSSACRFELDLSQRERILASGKPVIQWGGPDPSSGGLALARRWSALLRPTSLRAARAPVKHTAQASPWRSRADRSAGRVPLTALCRCWQRWCARRGLITSDAPSFRSPNVTSSCGWWPASVPTRAGLWQVLVGQERLVTERTATALRLVEPQGVVADRQQRRLASTFGPVVGQGDRDRFRCGWPAWRTRALATFRILAKDDLHVDAALASAVGHPPLPRPLTLARDRSQTRGAVLRGARALPRLSPEAVI